MINKTHNADAPRAKIAFLSIFACVAAAQLSACYGDNDMIDEYIGNRDYLITCRGRCLNEDRIEKDDCSGPYAVWIDNSASKTNDPDKTNAKSGRCIIQSADLCAAIGNSEKYKTAETGKINWLDLDFQMRDFGNGIYGRFIAKNAYNPQNDPSERKDMDGWYVCGTFDQVNIDPKELDSIVQNNALPCSEEQIKKLKVSFQGRSCPVMADKCSYNAWFTSDLNDFFNNENDENSRSKQPVGICSTCDVGLISCGGKCVDLSNDPENCGGCGANCNADGKNQKFCKNRECADVQECNSPAHFCDGDKSDVCVNPLSDDTCGATCDNLAGTKCPGDKTCVIIDDDYECRCDSGIYEIRNGEMICINASDLETCGATAGNPKGNPCVDGESCEKDNQGNYACVCPSGITRSEKYQDSENGPVIEKRICVNPESDAYCGANKDNPEGIACNSASHCEPYETSEGNAGYRCACNANWQLGCYDENGKVVCLDIVSDSKYCGMTADDCASLTTSTQICGDNQSCVAGQCVCNDGSILCETADGSRQCINANSNINYCGAKGLCNSDNPQSQNFKGAQCASNEVCQNGACECKGGTRCSDNTCPDPSYVKTCGIKSDCTGGEDCTKSGRVCASDSNNHSCVCPNAGEIYCGATADSYGHCIDPKTNGKFCGATAPCGDNPGEDCSAQGKVCRYDANTNLSTCETSCAEDLVKCGNDCVDMNVYHVTRDCKQCNLDYCYTGNPEDLKNDGAFDYKKCRLLDDYGNPIKFIDRDGKEQDANLKNSPYFCNGCSDVKEYNYNLPEGSAVRCPESMYCSSEESANYECACKAENTRCIYPSDDNGEDKVLLCQNFEKLHLIACEECAQGYGNCDGDWTNGCETDFSDPETCGACNINCSETVANAFGASCKNMQCDYVGCLEAHGDCDANRANGCELSGLDTNMNNCGRCNSVCKASKCENGTCCWEDKKDIGSTEKCCNGYKKYYYKHSGKCWGSSEYRCADSKPYNIISSCWQEVSD